MINIEIKKISSDKVIVDLESIKKLISIAEKIDKVNLIETEEDISTNELMKLTEKNGSFDFLNDKKEDLYSINDLKVKYK